MAWGMRVRSYRWQMDLTPEVPPGLVLAMEQPQGPSKRIRKMLREAAGEAYRRELNAAMKELDAWFDKWRKGEMSPFELSDKIHEFHQGSSRDLWSRYSSDEAGWTVPLAVAKGVLRLEELPPDLAEWVRPHAEAMKRDGMA